MINEQLNNDPLHHRNEHLAFNKTKPMIFLFNRRLNKRHLLQSTTFGFNPYGLPLFPQRGVSKDLMGAGGLTQSRFSSSTGMLQLDVRIITHAQIGGVALNINVIAYHRVFSVNTF